MWTLGQDKLLTSSNSFVVVGLGNMTTNILVLVLLSCKIE